ncbi:MAG: hypothetical protein QM796_20775 [Chthoniobacteraceae bacterium]
MPGIEETGVLDAIAHDPKTDEIVLIMQEQREWSGGDEQLFQLQEKLNTYLSFALDGELAEAFPQMAGKKVRIQLDTPKMPDERTLDFLQSVYDQIALQEIRFELHVTDDDCPPGEGGCGHGCGCHHG